MRMIVLVSLLTMAAGVLQPRALRLRSASEALDAEFIVVTSVRELADGRVLIPEASDRGLLVADFAAQSVKVVGRKGRGPGEYQFPSRALAVGHDSSLVIDLLVRRWLVMRGAEIVRTIPPDNPALVATQGSVTSADTLGSVLVVTSPPFEGERIVSEHDSSVVLLVSRATGRVDTVARVRRRPVREERYTDSTGRVIRSSSAPTITLTTEEGAELFPDGWIAITRLDPFRVDWRRPDGAWIPGRALPVPVIRYTARERAARLRRNGPASAPPPGFELPRPRGSAATLPPYEIARSALTAATDGRLLIRRTPSADYEGTRYLVINREGRLDGELVFNAATKIVGFGAGRVYVVEKDADDFLRLRRHAWPPQ